MNEPQYFNFGKNEVRTVLIDNEPWFVVVDIARVINSTNPSSLIEMVDEDERAKQSLGRQGEANIVNESGLYTILIRSKNPKAKPFRKWVTSEVLPSIRKTGSYQVPTDPMSALKLMFDATSQIDSRVTELEENTPLSPSDYGHITRIVNEKIGQVIAERQLSPNKKQRSLLYKEINGEVKKVTGTPTRSQLRQRHFEIVTDFVRDWQPSNAALVVYQQLELTESEVG